MSIPLKTILSWFQAGDFPTEQQFAESWKSFYHKEENIPVDKVENLNVELQKKADASAFETHLISENSHNATLAKLDASNLNEENTQAWKTALGVTNTTLNPASNYLVYWDGNDFAASSVYYDGTKYGVGTTAPGEMLHLNDGRLRAKAMVFDDNPESLPYQITHTNRRYYGADLTGTPRMFMYRDFTDYKTLWQNFSIEEANEMRSVIRVADYSGYLKKTDSAPTTAGLYRLIEIGSYPNLTPAIDSNGQPTTITVVDGKLTEAYFNGINWSISELQLPQSIPNGKIDENDSNSISGDTAFKRLIEGKDVVIYSTWEPGYYLNTGVTTTGTTYNMERTPKFLVKKGQTLKCGINTFNTAGSTAAIFNTYNLDGSFKANILKHTDFLNQFKEFQYTATEDILAAVTSFSTATFGTKYIRIESLLETSLSPINERVKVVEANQNQILNGSSELLPEQTILINLASYYYSHNGQVAPTAYGHKRTALILLDEGQTISYGVNTYTQIGSVAVLNSYNLNGSFKANIKKLDSTILAKFITGTYTASTKEYVAVTDYSDGAYGTAYIKILASEPFNYHKGITYLLGKDKTNDTKFSILSPSDLEADRMYQRGLAKLNLSATKDILLICMGQSNIDGRNDKATFPPQYLNAQDEVKGILMWNDNIKEFTPFKFGVGGNTGGGAPGAKSELESYGFDIIAAAMLAEYTGKTIHIVKRSLGGTAIDVTGTKGGGYWTPYTEDITSGKKLIEELKIKVLNAMAANPNLEAKAILNHQGEGDSTASARVKYYQNEKNVIRYSRGIVGNPKLPFIFGTISTSSLQYTDEVNNAQHQIATEDKFTHLIDMSEGSLFDSYHFDPASTLLFAQKVFNVLKNL